MTTMYDDGGDGSDGQQAMVMKEGPDDATCIV
jgi:hypothetical protein